MANITVGIDVSQKYLDLCVLSDDDKYYRFENDQEGFKSIINILSLLKSPKIGYEATGTYHKKLEDYLFKSGITPIILVPIAIANYRKAIMIRDKTDLKDSFVIAKYLRDGDTKSSLRSIIRDKYTPITTTLTLIDKQIRQSKNLVHSLEKLPNDPMVIYDLDKMIYSMSEAYKNILDNALIELHKDCPEVQYIKDEIKGAGDKVLLYIVPHIYESIDKYTPRQIISFLGLAPVSYQSGTSIYKKPKLSNAGDKTVKKILYMSTISAIRNNEIISEKYKRLKSAGKPSKVAIVACMNHLVRAIIHKLNEARSKND